MTPPVLTFFNNKGGVGKTSLLYHLAWMFADLGKRVVAVDLDPQSNLTAAFFDEEDIASLWDDNAGGTTIFHAVKPLTGIGDIVEPKLQKITDDLYLIPGDVGLSAYEDTLSKEWSESLDDDNLYRPMRILSAFWQVMQRAAGQVQADVILVDIGPNLGAINRSVLIATDYVMLPLGADLFSLQGLKNLGPALKKWKSAWQKRLANWHESVESADYPDFQLPQGQMKAIGYLCQQYSVRLGRPVKAYDKWANRIPAFYRDYVLDKKEEVTIQKSNDQEEIKAVMFPHSPDYGKLHLKPENDPHCLATVKHYRSLIPLGQEHRKPIFKLTAADGVIGSHAVAVQDARRDFQALAGKIAEKIGLSLHFDGRE